MITKLNLYLAAVIFGCVVCVSANSAEPQNKRQQPQQRPQWLLDDSLRVPTMLETKAITLEDIPNPHRDGQGCLACHPRGTPPTGKNMRGTKADKICRACHDSLSAHRFIHPSGMRPSKPMRQQMSKPFRDASKKAGGRVTCAVCHEPQIQCLPKRRRELGLNPKFLRAGPYRGRTAVCYQCHDKNAYQRLNPHNQIDDRGELRKERCALCHRDLDKLDNAKSIDEVDFNVEGELKAMCTGCHPWRPHPGGQFSFRFSASLNKGPNHLVIPSHEVKRWKQQQTERNGILLPLDPNTGKVFCGTCHNPHEKGVIKVKAAAHGADEKKRLRKQNICTQCHDK